jgi:bacteriocin-like protein
MNTKISSQVSDSIKHTSEKLPAEFIELSEEDLKQIVGGKNFFTAMNEAINKKTQAINNTVNGLFQGDIPNWETIKTLVIPTHYEGIRRWFGWKPF